MNTYGIISVVVTICAALLITSPIWVGIAYGIGKVIDRRKVQGIMPNNTPTGRVIRQDNERFPWGPTLTVYVPDGYVIGSPDDFEVLPSDPSWDDIVSAGIIRKGKVTNLDTFSGSGKTFTACTADNCRANCCR